ncbi:MAG TPA: CDP-glycerol glycerophosphotransferase family protein [Vicinamibacterales bacterium]|nr:CDP-glycerol glycerophosphotransferase family protein [Vicinamibacterales bacterium]
MTAALKRSLKWIDHTVGRLVGPRRVLFDVRTPVNAAILRPIIRAIDGEGETDGKIMVEQERDDVRVLLQREGWAARLVPRQAALRQRWDLYVNADPWGAPWLPRCARRLNFFHGVAGKYDLDNPAGLPIGFETYDRIAFVNEDRMRRYVAAGIIGPEQAALVGYPKLDALVSGQYSGAAERRALGLDPSRPVVLYAPTYSTASSLHLAGEAIVTTLLGAGFNVIVKLHDRSLDTDSRYTGGIDWRRRFAALRQPRFVFAECDDASPLLAAADLMVTDHSSIGFEFLVLDRPLLVFDAPELAAAARINPDKIALLRRTADVVAKPAALVAAARSALADPRRRSTERCEVARLMFYRPGGATARALRVVRALLEAPAVGAAIRTATEAA